MPLTSPWVSSARLLGRALKAQAYARCLQHMLLLGVSKIVKSHYDKVICLCCFAFFFVNIGLPSTSFGVYQHYIVAAKGMNDTLAGMILSVRALVSLLATFLVAHYYRRLDCRVGIALATALTGAGFLVYSFAVEGGFALFAAGAVLCGIGYGFGGAVGMTLIIGRWFKDGVGKASGFSAAGSGVAGAVFPIISVHVIGVCGLQAAFLVEAIFAFCIAVVVFVFLRNSPRDMGLEPHTTPAAHHLASKHASSSKELPRGLYTLLVGAIAGIGAGCTGGIAYVGILMSSSGVDEYFSAALVSVAGAALVVGKFGVGAVMDVIGTKRASLLFLLLFVAGLALCCLAPLNIKWLCAAGVVMFGLGASLGSTGLSVWAIEFSQPQSRSKVARDFQSSYALGGFVFNLIPGVLAQLTGSYVPSFALIAIFVAISMFVVMYVYNHIRS